MIVVLIPGSWGYRDEDTSGQWWDPRSPFVAMLIKQGHRVMGTAPLERAFVWSTNVNGVYAFDKFMDWRAGGQEFYQYCVPSLCPSSRVPPKDLCVIAHSHGLQVARFAAETGLEIGHLVSVCSPIRSDVIAKTPHARANITKWTHIYSDDSDCIQVAGDDDWWSAPRTASEADQNIFVPGVGHTGLVDRPDPAQWQAWLI